MDFSIQTEFVCTATAGQGTFTVPASVLTQLPAEGVGNLSVSRLVDAWFSAPLTAGGTVNGMIEDMLLVWDGLTSFQ